MTTSDPREPARISDPRFDAAWRRLSAEEPPASVDAAIRAAARREVGAKPQRTDARVALGERRRWWPLAAAATIAAIAVGVLQLTPPDRVGAPPAETTTVTDMPAPAVTLVPDAATSRPHVEDAISPSRGEAPAAASAPRADAPRRAVPQAAVAEPRLYAPSAANVPPAAPQPFPSAPPVASKEVAPPGVPAASAPLPGSASLVGAAAPTPAPAGAGMAQRAQETPSARPAPLAKTAAGRADDAGRGRAPTMLRRCRSRTGSRSSGGCATRAGPRTPPASSPRFAPRTPITRSCCRPICATGGRRRSSAGTRSCLRRQRLLSNFLIGAGSAAASAPSRVTHRYPGASTRVGHARTRTRCGWIVSR